MYLPVEVACEAASKAEAHIAKNPALGYFAGGNTEMHISPQSEVAGSQATGNILFSGTSIGAGTLALYIGGDRVAVSVAAADTPADVAAAVVAAISADQDLPVTAILNVTPEQVDITAKSSGVYGDDITLDTLVLQTDEDPANLNYVITDMTGGVGTPDIQTALDGLGTGDERNSDFFTTGIHGYGQDTTTLDAVANYVGQGDQKIGLYDPQVHRPMRWLNGDTAADTAGLSALIALGDGRTQDRANGIIPAPGSQTHPVEVACEAASKAEAHIAKNPALGYYNLILTRTRVGAAADRWTKNLSDRQLATAAGIGITKFEDNVLKIQKLLTFYHPVAVPESSNIYAEWESIAKIQNILYNQWLAFASPTYDGKTIVKNTVFVTDPEAKKGVVDQGTVLGTLTSLVKSFAAKAWIFDLDFSLENLATAVTLRLDGKGFDINMKHILSGTSDIIDTNSELDTSIAVLFN
jgi:phage tail sheath gpL-like